MAADTTTDSAIAGLDSLELAARRGGHTSARIAKKAWRATWPKLLAIAIVLGAWQLFYASNFHGDSTSGLVKSPGHTLGNLAGQLRHGTLWGAIGVTLQTAVIGYLLALLSGSLVGAVVSRIPPLRVAVGSITSGLPTMPPLAWFPFGLILVGRRRGATLFGICPLSD